MTNIYYIGGSPCSGKSTVAEMIAEKFGLYYFKVDDFLFENIAKAKEKGKVCSTKASLMSVDETWLRAPEVQCEEELAVYREIFEFAIEDLGKIQAQNGIITEGAAYLPELMRGYGIDEYHYICVVPTKEFQYYHYRQRPWVPYVLEGCSNKVLAFENWMERDVLFAAAVRESAIALGYQTFLTDRTKDSFYTYEQVCNAFGLIEKYY